MALPSTHTSLWKTSQKKTLKGNERIYLQKEPKRFYNSSGNVNELVGAPMRQQYLLLAHQDA